MGKTLGRHWRIKNILLFTFTLIIAVLVICWGLYTTSYVQKKMLERESEYIRDRMIAVSEQYERYFSLVNALSRAVYLDEFYNNLRSAQIIETKSGSDYAHRLKIITDSFLAWRGLLGLSTVVENIGVIDNTGHLLTQIENSFKAGFDFSNEKFYKQALVNLDAVISDCGKGAFFTSSKADQKDSFIIIVKRIIAPDDYTIQGVLIIIMDWKQLNVALSNYLVPSGYSSASAIKFRLTINDSGAGYGEKIPEKLLRGKGGFTEYEGRKYIAVEYAPKDSAWKLESMRPVDDICSDINRVRIAMFGFAIPAIIVTLLIIYLFSRSITHALEELRKYAAKIEKGIFDEEVEIRSYAEINSLAAAFNSMRTRLKEMITINYELAINEKEAQIMALQSQINPHFLYNTLNVIVAIAQINGINDISDISYAMADLLRYSIKGEDKLVEVREEINHVNNYILIQNIRFNREIDFKVEIDRNIEKCKIIKFTIQPILENAVFHGIEGKNGDKVINIYGGFIDEDTIIFKITDNGVGIDDHKLEEIKRYIEMSQFDINNKGTYGNFGIGLKNVNQRIKLTFGNKYGLKIESEKNTKTVISMTFPATH